MSRDPYFDGLWVANTLQQYLSKAGRTAITNNSLLRIDEVMSEMSVTANLIIKHSKEQQSGIFSTWLTFTFVMVFICTPILIALNADIHRVKIDLRIIMAPVSLAWVALVPVLLMILRCIDRNYRSVLKLGKEDRFKHLTSIRGRNTIHCSFYNKSEFANTFIIAVVAIILFFYLGVFIKIYCANNYITFTEISPISFAPALFIYAWKLIKEPIFTKDNWKKKQEHLAKMIEKYGQKGSSLQQHQANIIRIDMGLLSNVIVIPGFFYLFWVGLCLKFDGKTSISLFVLLIPLWIIGIALIVFTVLNGLSTQNKRASKCEKILLSLMVPMGICISFILLVLQAEKIIKTYVFVLLIPHGISLACLYLYLRCLVKPIRIHVKVTSEDQLSKAKQEN